MQDKIKSEQKKEKTIYMYMKEADPLVMLELADKISKDNYYENKE